MPSKLKILFIGSNPSVRTSSSNAFAEDTVSGRILRSWVQGIDGVILYDNVISQVTKNNRPLHSNEISDAIIPLKERINRINPDRLIALGKSATAALKALKLNFLEMPHPSGLNRKLNDKEYVNARLNELQQYCNNGDV